MKSNHPNVFICPDRGSFIMESIGSELNTNILKAKKKKLESNTKTTLKPSRPAVPREKVKNKKSRNNRWIVERLTEIIERLKGKSRKEKKISSKKKRLNRFKDGIELNIN